MLRPIRPLLAISGCLLTLGHAFDGESRLVPGCRNFLTAHAISRRSLQQEPRALLLTRPGLPSGRFRESAERATGENTNGDLKGGQQALCGCAAVPGNLLLYQTLATASEIAKTLKAEMQRCTITTPR